MGEKRACSWCGEPVTHESVGGPEHCEQRHRPAVTQAPVLRVGRDRHCERGDVVLVRYAGSDVWFVSGHSGPCQQHDGCVQHRLWHVGEPWGGAWRGVCDRDLRVMLRQAQWQGPCPAPEEHQWSQWTERQVGAAKWEQRDCRLCGISEGRRA